LVRPAIELHRWESGRGRAVLCIHETATSSLVWRPLAEALGDEGRTIAYDRRGWGRSDAPEPYTRTTIHEQAEDAARVLAEAGSGPAVACGAGLGAVTALSLTLGRPDLVVGAVLIEPPLLAFVEEATEQLSQDGSRLRQEIHDGGPSAGVELYLAGELPALGPGADRIPQSLVRPARERPLSLFAELAAVASWPLPLAEMARSRRPARIVVSESSPPMLSRAANELTARLAAAELRELSGDQPPHVGDPRGLAAEIRELA
jgi:pimeloyl-ACP methyl ester carboxylesterase